MTLKKDKFEFNKLEIPRTLSIETQPENTNTEITIDSEKKEGKNRIWLIALIVFCLLIAIFSIYFIMQPTGVRQKMARKTASASYKPSKTTKTLKTDTKPTYFNYFDSIIFLNNHTGNKVVISKGFDEYIKKNKLIIKSGQYYYNCFCDDLFEVYMPGDRIP